MVTTSSTCMFVVNVYLILRRKATSKNAANSSVSWSIIWMIVIVLHILYWGGKGTPLSVSLM